MPLMNVTADSSGQSPCAATISSAPSPFCTVISVAPEKCPASRAARRRGRCPCTRGSRGLRRAARRVVGRGDARGEVGAARDAQALARSSARACSARRVSTETSATRARCAGEEAADRAGSRDADAGHRRSHRHANSRPPVMPVGRTIRTSAISAPTTIEPRARRQVDRHAEDLHAVLGLGEERVERAHGERADDRAPQARRAADDEHGERDEGQIEVHRLGVERQQVDVEAAGEPGDRAREGEREQPLPVDRDAGGRGGGAGPRASRAAAGRSGCAGTRTRRRSRAARRSSPARSRSSPAPTRTCSARGRSSRSSAARCA